MILIYYLAYLSLNMYNTYISIIVREKVENMAETLYKKVVKNGSSLAINIPAKEVKEQNLIVTESGGLTSHAAVVGLSLGIPVIVGVKDALQIVEDKSYITLEASTGNVHRGHASVL